MTKQSQIDVSVNNVEINTFALFGISANNQTIIDSNVNISLQFPVLTGALLCIICDVDVQQCNLVFIAKGQQVSGLIIEPKERVNIQSSFIQFRICSMNSSGIANIINQSSVTFSIYQCKLTGFNILQSKYNGYIASSILVNIQLNITQMYICVAKTQRFGTESVQISIIGSDSIQCDICEQQQVVYGLCGEVLNYSENVDGMYQCVYPFEYVDNKCVCAYGYLLNNSKCINITESLNNISNQVNSGNSASIQLLEQKVLKIENQIIIVDQSILGNITEIENSIISNYSKSDFNLITNVSTLDNRIHNNITSIKNDILITQITADNNLLSNTTVLDWRIFNNVSQINTNLQNLSQQLIDLNISVQQQNLIIQQQQNIINNLIQQINCTSNYGYSMINGACIQVTCAIQGQQSINGICQCTNINSIIQDGSCVCPSNSNVIGTACVCSITGQTMQSGQCLCSTTGAFVVNNACTCGVNSINISNTCSCPSGAILVNGVCTCSNINAFISGNQCVCPTYSSLVGNTCTCPTNSQIVNNICTCNEISGQIMNNGACQCQTVGAFVKSGACSCGVNAQNVSNACMCPTNSSLINNVCTCDIIIGQVIINETCQCPSGLSIINNSCQQTNYTINISNFECSQQVFTQTFDIQSITNQISSSNNFSAGYVFSTSNVIQNAFIDIQDNVYSPTVNPLFQSQSSFTNLKIQIGTQSLNSGQFIISSSSSVYINQMNIISKPDGSLLTVNSAQQFYILTSSSSTVNITNLLVNLSFASSSGNITLINNINGVFNISGYQVLGIYISTGTVAMVGFNVNSATVNVNQVSFKPTAFNVGNGSSYLFGNAATTSTVLINNFAVILGSISNFLLLGSISTTSQLSNYYLFGGIMALINSKSVVSVNNVILDSYQQFSTSYVTYSGFLVGQNINSIQCSITIKNVCLQQNSTSTTLQFTNYGIIGYNIGNTSVQNMSITFSTKAAFLSNFGIIGSQYNGSIYTEVLNVKTSVSISSDSGNYVGSLFGYEAAKNCSVQNTSVIGGNVSAGQLYMVGGFIGYQNQNATIQNSSIQQTSISGSTFVGGFFGVQYQNATIINSSISHTNISGSINVGGFVGCLDYGAFSSTFYLRNSKIQQVRILGSSDFGIVTSYVPNTGAIYFTSSSSTQIYVNNFLRSECAVLYNWNGC
ncbi:Conserved_hypothetical protein [Hexamita inflata]|uniref:Uncharacterized protein n=1 Tax=Hexamita inflata TaxID=28002 RepID=A0AA86RCC7_9EUKA|nr:Conserved hypothetical protein [Hexamita inflata]